MAAASLTDEQKNIIRENFQKTPDLMFLTRLAFNDDSLKGSSAEGHAVRAFLSRENLKYDTTLFKPKEEIELTEDEKTFILSNLKKMQVLEMAQHLWKDKIINHPASQECRTVAKFIRSLDIKLLKSEDKSIEPYQAPTSIEDCARKLQQYNLASLNLEKLTQQNKDNLESLLHAMKNYRFNKTINSYTDEEDRELFESIFMGYVWDKEKMIPSDIELCVSIAGEFVISEQARKRKYSLDIILDKELVLGAQGEKIKLNDTFTKLQEKVQELYDSTQQRIKDMNKSLEGTRTERMKSQTEANRSILILVEQMVQEDTRQQLVKIVGLQEKLSVENEIQKVMELPDYIARIYGVSVEELKG